MRYPAIVIALMLTSCGSALVTTHFATVQEARSKDAFERGWLPPVLPDSTRNITENNDLDLNTGNGSFEFRPSDYSAFVSRLAPASPEVAKLYWSSQATKGFAIFTYTDPDAFWSLALHPDGQGFYTVESRH